MSLVTKPTLLGMIWKNGAGHAARWCSLILSFMHQVGFESWDWAEVCGSFAGMSPSPAPQPHWFFTARFLCCLFSLALVFISPCAGLLEIPSGLAVCWLRLGCHQYQLCPFCQLPVLSHCHLGSLEPFRGFS